MEGRPEEFDEHMARNHDFDDALNSENGGKELKNKMVNKLGEILDQALKNLIPSTQKPSVNKTWSGGAITLLRNNKKRIIVSSSIANSVLAKDLHKVIRRNENGSSAKTQPKTSQSAYALQQNTRLAVLSSEAIHRQTLMLNPDDLSTIYKCPICYTGFETTSIRNKHMSRVHNNLKKYNHIETTVQSCLTQQAVPEVPKTPAKVCPMFSPGAMNRRGIKIFNNTCSEKVRACAKQALRDLEIKSRLKHYTFSAD